MLNAAAFSHQCRGIRRKTQKNKGPAKARQGDEKANQDEGMDGGDEQLVSPGKFPNSLF